MAFGKSAVMNGIKVRGYATLTVDLFKSKVTGDPFAVCAKVDNANVLSPRCRFIAQFIADGISVLCQKADMMTREFVVIDDARAKCPDYSCGDCKKDKKPCKCECEYIRKRIGEFRESVAKAAEAAREKAKAKAEGGAS